MHQSSPIAGRWLARGLAVTIFLYWLLLLALWSDSQHSDVSVAISSATTLEQPLQLVRNDVIIGEGSISVNSSQLNTSSVSSKTMLKTFLDSDGPSTLGVPQFSCLGWRQTGGCSPDGPREPDNDANCGKNIKAGASGYCLLKNEATGEEVQAMRVNCSTMREENLASVNANAAERYEYMTTNFHVRIFGGGIFRNFPMCYGDNKMKSEHFKTTPWGELPFGDLEDQLHDFTQEAGALEKSSEIQ
ncbi:hypothetical protein PF006_g10859 [Phytophthora fragariae]|uniref:Uncharacterized protein n=1 Tax=Phytophthora fragariae TaxID=53985 RepID=A0A6A3TZ27_9STRA|nr:hypothetical protein PF006_g10859 [Phytophthora fragariae]